uniref:Uncharacterized protein n=1 Tax=Steinernema glaseri TaxID=37863 RepID=A0A1I8AGF8_9BILA
MSVGRQDDSANVNIVSVGGVGAVTKTKGAASCPSAELAENTAVDEWPWRRIRGFQSADGGWERSTWVESRRRGTRIGKGPDRREANMMI